MSDLTTCPNCNMPWGTNVDVGCEGCEEWLFGMNRRDAERVDTLLEQALADEAERGYDPDKMIPRRIIGLIGGANG